MTIRCSNGSWCTPHLLSPHATSPCPAKLPSKSPSKAHSGRNAVNVIPSAGTHIEISKKKIPPPMSAVPNLARYTRQSMLRPSALPAADLLLVCLFKLLSPASCSLALKSTDFREDVNHLYNNDHSKPHYVQREVIFTG